MNEAIIKICEWFTEPSQCENKDCKNCRAGKFVKQAINEHTEKETTILKATISRQEQRIYELENSGTYTDTEAR